MKNKQKRVSPGPFIPYKVNVSYNRTYFGRAEAGMKWTNEVYDILKRMKVGGSIEIKDKDHIRLQKVRKILQLEEGCKYLYRFTQFGAKEKHFLVFKLKKK